MTNNPLDLSEQDIADLRTLAADQPEETAAPAAPMLTLLEIWSNVLSNIEGERRTRIDPVYATRVLQSWRFLKIQEVSRYRDLYFDYLAELRDILDVEIETDPEALGRVGDGEDAVDNKVHYLNLLLTWNLQALQWGKDWDSEAPDAHITVAAFADAQNFVLGEKGLIAHLDVINFEYLEDEADAIAQVLVEAGREA